MVGTKTKKGFTLVELLICVAILAVLAAISIPIISGLVDNANDRSDKLMAELFSSYMTKYANEDPGPISNYTQLSSSEQSVVYYAGNNYFPGTLQSGSGAYSTDEQVWEAIRREAIVAMKMYGEEVIVADNYYITGPKNTQHNYIYYYLTGKVVAEDINEVIEKTEKNIANGKDVPDNYWVALDTNAGNAEAVTTTSTGQVYINLYYYGLGIPHPVGELKNQVNSDIYLQNTVTGQKFYVCNNDVNDLFYNNNVLQFENVTKGSYQLYINSYMVTNIPSSEYGQLGSFSTSGSITVSDSGYAGMTMGHPYRAYLLAVTKGNVAVYYKTSTFNNSGRVGTDVKHEYNEYYNLAFNYVPSLSNDQNVNFSVSYPSNGRHNIALYDTSVSKYLPYGKHNLKYTSDAHRDVTAQIISSRYGIYDVGTTNTSSSEFNYEIITRKNVVTISGTIDFGTAGMPLNGSVSATDKNKLSSTYDVNLTTDSINTEVYFISTDGKYSRKLEVSDLTYVSDGVYSYTLENVEWDGDGTYYEVWYANSFKSMVPIKVTTQPTFVEGFDITGNYTISDYFKNCTITASKKAFSENVYSSINSNIKFTNVYTGVEYNCTNGGQLSLPCGFYDVSIVYPVPYNVNETVRVLVCDSNVVFNFVRTFSGVTLSGTLQPTSGDTYLSGVSTSFSSKITLSVKYTNVDGTSDTLNGTITANGNKANYTIVVPLAKTYDFTFANSDSKCFTNKTATYSPQNTNTTRTQNYNMERNTSKSESNHRGDWAKTTVSDSTHTVTCNFCGLQLNNHTASTEQVTQKGTCTANGSRRYVCNTSGCGYVTNTYTISARGHNHVGSVETASTCWYVGTTRYTCNRTATTYYTACSDTYTRDDIPKKDHNYSSSFTVTSKGTCTTNGSKEKRCSNFASCGGYTERTAIPARGHSWNGGSTTKNATCTAGGNIRYTCTRSATTEYAACAQTKDEATSALGHNYAKNKTNLYSAATCTADAVYYKTCTRCGGTSGTWTNTGSALGHNYTENTKKLYSAATCTADAKYYKSCTRCSATNGTWTKSGTSLGHDYSSKTKTSTYLKYSKSCAHKETYYYKCSRCTSKGTSTYTVGEYSNHTPSSYWISYDTSHSTNYSEASHWHYNRCTVCGATARGGSVRGLTLVKGIDSYSWAGDILGLGWVYFDCYKDDGTYTREKMNWYYCGTCGYDPGD